VIGTPQYMPPEQAAGQLERVGPTSDVYAVGAMLYQLLAGRAPYVELTGTLPAVALLSRVIAAPPEPIRARAPPRARSIGPSNAERRRGAKTELRKAWERSAEEACVGHAH